MEGKFRHRMILFFYNVALLVVLVAGAPWWLWRMATTRQVPRRTGGAAGRVPPELVRLGRERPMIWLHAVSVGEVLAVSRLVRELDGAFPGTSW